jgi:uncharacterized MAPEG superfamily protein
MDISAVPHSIVALVFYALWAIALVLMVAMDRVLQVMRGEAHLTSFTPGVPHGTDSYWRLNRAHLNTVENLAIFAAVVLTGYAAGVETYLFNLLAVVVVVARIAQSVVHITSGSAMAMQARFGLFGIQIVCEIWMAILVLQGANLF